MVHTSVRNSAMLGFKYNLIMCSSPVVNVKSIPRHSMFVQEPLTSSFCEGEYISFHYLGCGQNLCFSCPCSTLSDVAVFYIIFAFSFSQEWFQFSVKHFNKVTHSFSNFQMELLYARKNVRYSSEITISIPIYGHSD